MKTIAVGRRVQGVLRDTDTELGRGYVHINPDTLSAGTRARLKAANALRNPEALLPVRVDIRDLKDHRLVQGRTLSLRIRIAEDGLLEAGRPQPASRRPAR